MDHSGCRGVCATLTARRDWIRYGDCFVVRERRIQMLELKNPSHAYFFGFIQADGHLRRGKGNKGSLTVELGSQDRWLLEQFANLVQVYSSIYTRRRKTNFKDGHESAVWTVYDLAFRQTLLALGMPEGRKSGIVKPPQVEFSQPDYYRGIVDAEDVGRRQFRAGSFNYRVSGGSRKKRKEHQPQTMAAAQRDHEMNL